MKSTTTLRLARPPIELMYFANALTATGEPWKRPGASGFSSSATTAMRISSGLMPTSVAVGFSLAPCATAGAATSPIVTAHATHSATVRITFMGPPSGTVPEGAVRLIIID